MPEIYKESWKLNLKGIKQMSINKWPKRDTSGQNVFETVFNIPLRKMKIKTTLRHCLVVDCEEMYLLFSVGGDANNTAIVEIS